MTNNKIKTFLLDVQLRGQQAVKEMFMSLHGEKMLRHCLSKKYMERENFINNPPSDEPIGMYWNYKVTKKGLKYVSMH